MCIECSGCVHRVHPAVAPGSVANSTNPLRFLFDEEGAWLFGNSFSHLWFLVVVVGVLCTRVVRRRVTAPFSSLSCPLLFPFLPFLPRILPPSISI